MLPLLPLPLHVPQLLSRVSMKSMPLVCASTGCLHVRSLYTIECVCINFPSILKTFDPDETIVVRRGFMCMVEFYVFLFHLTTINFVAISQLPTAEDPKMEENIYSLTLWAPVSIECPCYPISRSWGNGTSL